MTIVNNPNINLPAKEIPSLFTTDFLKSSGETESRQAYYRPMLSLYFFLPGKKYLSLFTFALALLSKETAIMLPFALVILSIDRKGLNKGLLAMIPCVILVGAYLILRFQLTSRAPTRTQKTNFLTTNMCCLLNNIQITAARSHDSGKAEEHAYLTRSHVRPALLSTGMRTILSSERNS